MRKTIVCGLVLVLATVGSLGTTPAHAAGSEQVLVRFQPGVDAARVLGPLGASAVGSVYGTDVLVVRAPTKAVGALERHRLVDYVEPDHVLHLLLDNPDDPRFADQYALSRIKAVGGWSIYPGSYTASGGPKIAVIDTGVDASHPDLAGRVDTANSRCFLTFLLCLGGYDDDHGHGTHVGGTAAAATNNSTGVAGVAFNSQFMALKVCDLIGSCNTSAVASAINWATERGAKVINMSLGGSGNSSTLATAVRNSYNAGVVLVAAAGNDGNSTINYPAGYPEVISVAATDSNDNRASFSQRNETVEVAAPGVSVLSTYPGNRYTTMSGTSMASPHVAGLAALLRGQNPGWSPATVRARLQSCSDDLGTAGYDTTYGYGRINALRALGNC